MGRYASTTSVSTDRSQAEIKKTLKRYGADQWMEAADWEGGQAMIGFRFKGLAIRLKLPLPNRQDRAYTETPTGLERGESAAQKAWEQATRQRWRALCIIIKAKLEAVSAGITTLEEEFMAHVVVDGGQTVGERLLPEIHRAIEMGRAPLLLPMYSED